jgi:hypothetical protein
MRLRSSFTSAVLVISCLTALPKDRKKGVLPVDILQAHTVWVMVDPNVGADVVAPNADNQARADVESALAKWGRLTPVADPHMADLIIVVSKGSGKLVHPTFGGTPVNLPPPMIGQRTDNGTNAAGRQGGDRPPFGSPGQRPEPQMEAGQPDDSFLVYRNDPDHIYTSSLDSPPVWRYSAKGALAPPGVPAVERFHDAINQSEKALASSKP